MTATGKFCVSITHAKDDTDKATVGFVVANAAVGSDQDTMVFLSTEGARLAVAGYADDIHEEDTCNPMPRWNRTSTGTSATSPAANCWSN